MKGNDSMRVSKKERRKYNSRLRGFKVTQYNRVREAVQSWMYMNYETQVKKEYQKPITKIRYGSILVNPTHVFVAADDSCFRLTSKDIQESKALYDLDLHRDVIKILRQHITSVYVVM